MYVSTIVWLWYWVLCTKTSYSKLPNLIKGKNGQKKFVIEDSIEGWSDAVGVLVSSYFTKVITFFQSTLVRIVIFDYSKIRPAGAYLKSSGGKAPGPEPLKKCSNTHQEDA